MTQITPDDVRHLANLSALEVTDTEVESLTGDLERIVHYIERLSTVDTEGISPTYQVGDVSNVWREDEFRDGLASREQLLALSSDVKDNQIKVPKVL